LLAGCAGSASVSRARIRRSSSSYPLARNAGPGRQERFHLGGRDGDAFHDFVSEYVDEQPRREIRLLGPVVQQGDARQPAVRQRLPGHRAHDLGDPNPPHVAHRPSNTRASSRDTRCGSSSRAWAYGRRAAATASSDRSAGDAILGQVVGPDDHRAIRPTIIDPPAKHRGPSTPTRLASTT
jgi:hypothetical protein